MLTILCVATYLKGEAFLRECRARRCTVLLLTSDTLARAAWPHDAIDEVLTIARDAPDEDVRRTVAARFRDKLTMRTAARGFGLPVPEFVPLFNDAEVRDWTARVPAPWVI